MAISPLTLQADPTATNTLFSALSAAVVYSLLWYARSYVKDGEQFIARKFLATLIVGLFIAGTAWSAGVVLTEKGFAARMAVYVGLISIVEAILKTLYAEWYRVTGGKAGLATEVKR